MKKKILALLISALLFPQIAMGQINVYQGGTGKTSFPSGAIIVGDSAFSLTSTTSPTVGYITATSTTATSTFPRLTISTAVDFLGDYVTNGATWIRSKISETITGISYNSATGVFSLSAGYEIPLTASTTHWEDAYGWGDHSTEGYLTAESDPVFLAHEAYNITTGSTTNWQTAFGWGNHADEGYLTSYTESDPIWVASSTNYYTKTEADANYDSLGQATSTMTDHTSTYNHANYDTAYGWGDHGIVGYLTSLTPWTENIDGGGYYADNIDYITATGTSATSSFTAISIGTTTSDYALDVEGSIRTDTAFRGDYWISATGNSMNIQPSGDTDDFFSFKTPVDRPTIKREGGKYIYIESSNVNDVGISFRKDADHSGTINYYKDTEEFGLTSKDPLVFKVSEDYDDYIKIITANNIPELSVASSSGFKINAGGTNDLLLNHDGGNIGFGTSSTAYPFDFYGNARIDGTLTMSTPITDANVSDTLTVTGYMQDGDINTFAELNAWIIDGTLASTTHVWNDAYIASSTEYLVDNNTMYTATYPVQLVGTAFGLVSASTTEWDSAFSWGDWSGEGFITNAVSVLSSLVSVGTIGTGVWEATAIDNAYIASSTEYLADNDTTYVSSDFTHDDLTGFVANEHLDWTASVGTIHTDNYIENATHTGEVTGSGALTITDNIIDEVNLKVNTPTDDYVLTASSTASGGFAWAEVAGGGTVTSVDMSVPTGLAIAGNPITGAGTLALTYHADYAAVKTASTTEYDTAYGWGDHSGQGYLTTVAYTDLTGNPSDVITAGTGLAWDTDTLNWASTGLDWVGNAVTNTYIASSTEFLVDNDTTYVSSDFTHDDLTGFVANEHLDWTADLGAVNIHSGNYTDTNTTYTAGDFLTLTGTEFNVDATTTISNGDTTHLASADTIYDWAVGLFQTILTNSAGLLAALDDETGTGVVVFSTSPTLVTPALGTPSALVGTNITGTASGFTVGSSTALATARTIAGVSFDGTANINLSSTGLSDTADLLYEAELNTFSELQTQIADETLLKAGTLTDTKYCIYDSASTDIVCNSSPSGWSALSDMPLATGHFYIGDGSNNPIATSSIFMTTDGSIGIGTTDPAGDKLYSKFTMVSEDGSLSDFGNILYNDAGYPAYFLARARGNKGTPTIVQVDDYLGAVNFIGNDGTDNETVGATIYSKVIGTPAENDIKSDLYLTPTGGVVRFGSASSTAITISGNSWLGTISSGTWNGTTIAVANGGTGATTLTDHGVLVGSGTAVTTALAVGTNGQLLIGSTGADPVFATLNCDYGLTCTTGAGTLEIDADTASDTVVGAVELATTAETTTGTDATRAVTPDGLAGSTIFGRKTVELIPIAFDADTAVADGVFYFHIPASLNGMNLVSVHGLVVTAGTTGTTDWQVYNLTDTQDMLSTKLTIDTAETGSNTAATPAVINTTYDDVATNDVLRLDCDAIATTAAKGTIITLEFQLP